MTKLTNDEKIKRVKQRQILRYLIIIFGLLTLGLAIYSLVAEISPIYAIISFIIEFCLSKYRERINLREEVLDSENQE